MLGASHCCDDFLKGQGRTKERLAVQQRTVLREMSEPVGSGQQSFRAADSVGYAISLI